MVPVAGRYEDGSATSSSLRPRDPRVARPEPGCHPVRVPSPIIAEVVISDGGQTGRGRRTVLQLVWEPEDPLAVQLRLSAEPDHPALPRGDWVVLRDFLRYGLSEPTGDGEVRIRPDELRDRVWFELARPGRAACVSVPREVAQEFLDRTDAATPYDVEAAVDALVERLLASGS